MPRRVRPPARRRRRAVPATGETPRAPRPCRRSPPRRRAPRSLPAGSSTTLRRRPRHDRQSRAPASRRAPSRATLWRGGTIGSRNTSSHSPIAAIENFTGPGLDSQKFTCMRPSRRWCMRPGRGEVAALGGFHHVGHLARDLVRAHRDDAVAADSHERQRERVVARQHQEVPGTASHDLGHLRSCCRPLPSRRRRSGWWRAGPASPRPRCSRCGRARCRRRSAAASRRRWPR